MHHMIVPYQSIVYSHRLIGAMTAALSHSNKTVAFNEPDDSVIYHLPILFILFGRFITFQIHF